MACRALGSSACRRGRARARAPRSPLPPLSPPFTHASRNLCAPLGCTLCARRYHRIKFSLEGERNKKATVWAEVASSTGEFRYLIVTGRGDSKVISIVDRRPAVLSLVERQARVSTLLQDAGWVFLCDNEVDARIQGKELGDYWLKCKSSQDGERLRGVSALGGSCGWVTPGGEAVAGGRGVRDLAQLESMVLPLARGDKPGFFSGITSFFSGGGGGDGGGKPALG